MLYRVFSFATLWVCGGVLFALPKDMDFRAAEACGVANARHLSFYRGDNDLWRSDATCRGIRERVEKKADIMEVVCAGRKKNILYPDAVLVSHHDDLLTLYIAFPCWKSSGDTWTSLSFCSTFLNDIGLRACYGHGGLMRRYLSLRENLMEEISGVSEANSDKINTLVFCGHSIGASIATYAYADFKINVPGVNTQLVALAPVVSVLPRPEAPLEEDSAAKYFWFKDDFWKGVSSILNRVWGRAPLGEGIHLVDQKNLSWYETHRLTRYMDALDPN